MDQEKRDKGRDPAPLLRHPDTRSVTQYGDPNLRSLGQHEPSFIITRQVADKSATAVPSGFMPPESSQTARYGRLSVRRLAGDVLWCASIIDATILNVASQQAAPLACGER